MVIDIHQVLEAASTKWNFLNFKPGLVGGHCIGVDPYYLAHKANEYETNPEMILAGRRINDSMSEHIFKLVLKETIKRKLNFSKCRFLIYGLTFKENCPDFRNSQSLKVYQQLKDHNLNVDVYDPHLTEMELDGYDKKDIVLNLEERNYNSIICLVAHNEIKQKKLDKYLHNNGFIFDLKNSLSEIKNIVKL